MAIVKKWRYKCVFSHCLDIIVCWWSTLILFTLGSVLARSKTEQNGSLWNRTRYPFILCAHNQIATGIDDLRSTVYGMRLLEMWWNRKRRWTFLAPRSSQSFERPLMSLRSKRTTAIHRHLQALRCRLTMKRMQLCMLLFVFTLRSSPTIRSVWMLPSYCLFLACS